MINQEKALNGFFSRESWPTHTHTHTHRYAYDVMTSPLLFSKERCLKHLWNRWWLLPLPQPLLRPLLRPLLLLLFLPLLLLLLLLLLPLLLQLLLLLLLLLLSFFLLPPRPRCPLWW